MYYSSKVVTDKDPPVTTHRFQGIAKDATKRDLEQEIVELGVVNDIYYYFVPDGLELVDQPPKAEVTKLESLPVEVANELALDGDYANSIRYEAAVENVQYPMNVYEERNLANLWVTVMDINSVLAQLLEQSLVTLSRDGSMNTSLEMVKRLKAKTDKIASALSKVGL